MNNSGSTIIYVEIPVTFAASGANSDRSTCHVCGTSCFQSYLHNKPELAPLNFY